jgi:hypothetical protein
LEADNRRSRERREPVRPHPPLTVDRDSNDALAAKPEQSQGLLNARVHLVANDDGDGRRTEKAPRFHIPTFAGEQGVSGRGQTRHIGRGGARDEASPGSGGQRQEIDQPSEGNILESGGDGRLYAQGGVLIPGRGQPVRRQGSGQGPTNDEAKVAAARAGHRRRGADLVELGQHVCRLAGSFG